MIDPELHQRIAVVTGGNSGIGSAIVRRLASQGVYCVVHYLAQASTIEGASLLHETPGAAAANQVVEEITSAGGRAIAVPADLSDPCAPAQLFDSAEREFGGVDILVNNAAHCEAPDTIEHISAGTIDRHFQVNVRAATLLIHEFVERHRRRRADYGRVINITIDAARAFATQIAYGASKYALEGLTRSIAVEAGSLKITVNAIAPGPIQTGWITPALEAQVLPTIPLGCVGTPEDVADAVVFLASKQARWITGQVIQVAGGHAL